MIDDKPYIIVDNRKLEPISRSPRPDSATRDAGQTHQQSFGVVDRVTISREALEKSRQLADEEDRLTLLENRREGLTAGPPPMLTYSPNGKP